MTLPPTLLENNFTSELFEAVGKFFITTAVSENALNIALQRLLADPNPPTASMIVVIQGTPISSKLNQIKIAAKYTLSPQAAQTIEKYCDKIRRLYERRNEIAHITSYSVSEKVVSLIDLKVNAKGKFKSEKRYTVEQILQFSRMLHCRVRMIDTILNDEKVPKFSESRLTLPSSLKRSPSQTVSLSYSNYLPPKK